MRPAETRTLKRGRQVKAAQASLNGFERQRESVDKLAGRSISRESVVPDNWRVFAEPSWLN